MKRKFSFDIYYGKHHMETITIEADTPKEAYDDAVNEAVNSLVVSQVQDDRDDPKEDR